VLVVMLMVALGGYPPVLEAKGCATCHLSGHPEQNAKALAVFDLRHDGWAREIPEASVPKVRGRLVGKGASAAEIEAVMKFIAEKRL
jgi:hypothetical protein